MYGVDGAIGDAIKESGIPREEIWVTVSRCGEVATFMSAMAVLPAPCLGEISVLTSWDL